MNNVRTPAAFLLATAFALAGAHAHEPVTRAQVLAEYQEAQRTGDLLAPGDSGLKLNELYPDWYLWPASTPAKTRAQVVAELQAATRSGDMLAAGDTGMKENERHPERYPAAAAAAGETREQVRAETLEAIRTGDMLAGGDSGLKLNELFPQRYRKILAQDLGGRRDLASTTSATAGSKLQ